MGLGIIDQQQNRERKVYLSIHHGKVERSENGAKSYFSYVEGSVEAIYKKEREYNGEKVLKWFFELRDDGGELYCISFPYNSGTFKSIVLCLASASGLHGGSVVRIEPYVKGNFTNVVVCCDGVKLEWATKELPAVQTVTVGGKTYKDESKRMEFIESIVARLRQRLGNK